MAIFTVLLTVPSKCKVMINTDTQVSINIFKQVTGSKSYITKRKWLKVKNYRIWTAIVNTIFKKKLEIKFKKIKVYSSNIINNKVDKLKNED